MCEQALPHVDFLEAHLSKHGITPANSESWAELLVKAGT